MFILQNISGKSGNNCSWPLFIMLFFLTNDFFLKQAIGKYFNLNECYFLLIMFLRVLSNILWLDGLSCRDLPESILKVRKRFI